MSRLVATAAHRSRPVPWAAGSEGPRLAVASLTLAGWPGPDQAPGVVTRAQPVAEVVARDHFEPPHIILDQRDQRAALLPGERLPRPGGGRRPPLRLAVPWTEPGAGESAPGGPSRSPVAPR